MVYSMQKQHTWTECFLLNGELTLLEFLCLGFEQGRNFRGIKIPFRTSSVKSGVDSGVLTRAQNVLLQTITWI